MANWKWQKLMRRGGLTLHSWVDIVPLKSEHVFVAIRNHIFSVLKGKEERGERA